MCNELFYKPFSDIMFFGARRLAENATTYDFRYVYDLIFRLVC